MSSDKKKYQTNLVKGDKGNYLPKDEEFVIAFIKDCKSFITLKLEDSKGNLIGIDQTDGQTPAKINVYHYVNKILTRRTGTFVLTVTGDSSTSDTQGYGDKFTIL